MTAMRAVYGLSQNRVTAVYSAHTGQHHVHLCRLEIAATELISNVRYWPQSGHGWSFNGLHLNRYDAVS
jgi:hypothetical protein